MAILRNILAPLAASQTGRTQPARTQRWMIPLKSAGVIVNNETAMKYSAVWRCVTLISQIIATMPWHAMSLENKGGRITRQQLFDSPVDWVLHRQANPEMSAMTFRELMVAWALIDGNGYAEIERDRAGRVVWLWPLAPDRVTPDRDVDGNLVYKVQNPSREPTILKAQDVFHLKGLGYDGLQGYSVVSMAARSIALGLAAEEFGASYFSNGVTPSGVLEHPKNLGADAYDRLKKSLNDEHGGGPERAHSPLILEEGMVWKSISSSPEQAQFLENRRFQIADIARWFGVPLVMLEEKDVPAWGTGIEQIVIGFVNFTIRAWVMKCETEADIKLFGIQQRGRQFTKMNMNALLRGDLKSRAEFYKTMSALGVYSVNNILALEDENPIGPVGDKRLVPMNMTTLEKAGEEPPKPKPISVVPGTDDGDNGEDTATPSEDESGTRESRKLQQKAQLASVFSKTAEYEQNRCKQLCSRYTDDRSSFVRAMDRFYPGQERHMRANLSGPVHALAGVLNTHAHADSIVDLTISRHVEMSRLAMLQAFDNKTQMTAVDPTVAVEQIIEAML